MDRGETWKNRDHLASYNFSYQCLLLEVLHGPQGASPAKEPTATALNSMVCIKEINLFSLILGYKA